MTTQPRPLTPYYFSIPVKYADIPHPVGATPNDLLEVYATDEVAARLTMNRTYGNGSWCSVYVAAELDHVQSRYFPGDVIPVPKS